MSTFAPVDVPTENHWAPAPGESVPVPPPDGVDPAQIPTHNRVPERLQRAWQKMPSAGDAVFGFALVRELGRGAFGRVFLATQPELASRVVALKVSADLAGESRTLALLQHT